METPILDESLKLYIIDDFIHQLRKDTLVYEERYFKALNLNPQEIKSVEEFRTTGRQLAAFMALRQYFKYDFETIVERLETQSIIDLLFDELIRSDFVNQRLKQPMRHPSYYDSLASTTPQVTIH